MGTETIGLSLRRGSVHTLNNLLQAQGWYSDTKSAYMAGEILVHVMPDMEEVPKAKDGKPVSGEELKTWLDKEYTLGLSQKQLKTCKACIEHFIKQKQLPINQYTFELMNALGMKPDEE